MARCAGDLAQVDAGLGEQGGQRQHDAAADGGAALQLKAVDRGDHVLAAQRGRLHHRGGAGERHHRHAARCAADRPRRPWPPPARPPGGWATRRSARMLPDTSIASTMVSCCSGRLITACGRAIGQQQHRQRQEHQRRRHVAAPGAAVPIASFTRPRWAKRSAAALAPAQQPQVGQHQQRQGQQAPQHDRAR